MLIYYNGFKCTLLPNLPLAVVDFIYNIYIYFLYTLSPGLVNLKGKDSIWAFICTLLLLLKDLPAIADILGVYNDPSFGNGLGFYVLCPMAGAGPSHV